MEWGVQDLRKQLFAVALKQKIITTPIPQAYLVMEKLLRTETQKVCATLSSLNLQVISWKHFSMVARKGVHCTNQTALEELAAFLSSAGTIAWYNKPGLKEIIILEHQVLSFLLSHLLSII